MAHPEKTTEFTEVEWYSNNTCTVSTETTVSKKTTQGKYTVTLGRKVGSTNLELSFEFEAKDNTYTCKYPTPTGKKKETTFNVDTAPQANTPFLANPQSLGMLSSSTEVKVMLKMPQRYRYTRPIACTCKQWMYKKFAYWKPEEAMSHLSIGRLRSAAAEIQEELGDQFLPTSNKKKDLITYIVTHQGRVNTLTEKLAKAVKKQVETIKGHRSDNPQCKHMDYVQKLCEGKEV